MTAGEGESVEQWYTRAIGQFRTRQAKLADHAIRFGFDRPVGPDHLHSLLDAKFEAALDQFDDAALEMFQAARAAAADRAVPLN